VQNSSSDFDFSFNRVGFEYVTSRFAAASGVFSTPKRDSVIIDFSF
jgi:hypothetical protein